MILLVKEACSLWQGNKQMSPIQGLNTGPCVDGLCQCSPIGQSTSLDLCLNVCLVCKVQLCSSRHLLLVSSWLSFSWRENREERKVVSHVEKSKLAWKTHQVRGVQAIQTHRDWLNLRHCRDLAPGSTDSFLLRQRGGLLESSPSTWRRSTKCNGGRENNR
jgi:hypothetical protein